MKSLTVIRGEDDDFRQFRVSAQRSALRRLDCAFQAFLRRAWAGEAPGFPRCTAKHRDIRSFGVPAPVVRDGSHRLKGVGPFRLPSVPEGTIMQARVVKTALRVAARFAVAVDVQAGIPSEPLGIDVDVRDRAILSTGETVPAARIDRPPLRRAQRAVSRARGSAICRKKVNARCREWERARMRERNALPRISASIVKSRNRIAAEDLQVSNMMRYPNLARSIAEQQRGRLAEQLDCKHPCFGASQDSVFSAVCEDPGPGFPQSCPHPDTVQASGSRPFAVARAALPIRRRPAGPPRDVGPLGRPDTSEGVPAPHVAGLPGKDAERCTAD